MLEQAARLQGVRYDIRGPVLRRARQIEASGHPVLKLNLGNPAPFGLDAPEAVVKEVARGLAEAQGYSDARGIRPARGPSPATTRPPECPASAPTTCTSETACPR